MSGDQAPRVTVTCCGQSWPFEYDAGRWFEVRTLTAQGEAERARRTERAGDGPSLEDYDRAGRGEYHPDTGLWDSYENAPRVHRVNPDLPPSGLRWVDERHRPGPPIGEGSSMDGTTWFIWLQPEGWTGIGTTHYTQHYRRRCRRCGTEVRTPVGRLVRELDAARALGQDGLTLRTLNRGTSTG